MDLTRKVDLSELKEKTEHYIELMTFGAVSVEKPTLWDSVRTEIKKYIDTNKNLLNDARELYLKPFNEQAEPIIELIESLETAHKDFASRILDAKKIAFKKKVEEEFIVIVEANDGEWVDFEKVFDPKWYGKSTIEWTKLLVKKYRQIIDGKKDYEYHFALTSEQLRDLETYLIKNEIDYERI